MHAEVSARLDRLGQRYTANRRAVIATLVGAGAPLTLPEILERQGSLSQSSTYRSLAVLEEAGVVRRLVTGPDHARFELAEHLSAHHHHLVCEGCGSVTDFELDPDTEAALDAALHRVAGEHRFAVDQHTLDLVGRCAACA